MNMRINNILQAIERKSQEHQSDALLQRLDELERQKKIVEKLDSKKQATQQLFRDTIIEKRSE